MSCPIFLSSSSGGESKLPVCWHPDQAGTCFGERIKTSSNQTEEGEEVWFADATLLLFPVASFSHQFL